MRRQLRSVLADTRERLASRSARVPTRRNPIDAAISHGTSSDPVNAVPGADVFVPDTPPTEGPPVEVLVAPGGVDVLVPPGGGVVVLGGGVVVVGGGVVVDGGGVSLGQSVRSVVPSVEK